MQYVLTVSICFRASGSSENFGGAQMYTFLFIANLTQNSINQNGMHGKPKVSQAFIQNSNK